VLAAQASLEVHPPEHVPQCASSCDRSAQEVPQVVWGGLHVATAGGVLEQEVIARTTQSPASAFFMVREVYASEQAMRRMLLACLCACACSKPGNTAVDFGHKKVEGKPVASWSGDAITDAEVKQRLLEMSPYARARYQTLEQRKEYVDGLARFELLAQEALKRGLANDPEVVSTAKKVMVQQLLKQEMDPKGFQVSDAQVQEYYEKHKTDYVKPAMTRLAHVFFTKEHKDKAEATLKDALALQQLDYAGFAKLAKERSEEPRTQPIEGDMRFLSDEELAAQYGKELVEAQGELKQVGEVLPKLVETPSGFHVVRLQGRQVALNLTAEQVKTQITNVLNNESRQERYRALLEKLKDGAGYKVDEATLGAVEVDLKAAAAEMKGPTPGFIPPPEPKRQEK
jgi:peptidyl-prolyl cis-trans isomerase C